MAGSRQVEYAAFGTDAQHSRARHRKFDIHCRLGLPCDPACLDRLYGDHQGSATKTTAWNRSRSAGFPIDRFVRKMVEDLHRNMKPEPGEGQPLLIPHEIPVRKIEMVLPVGYSTHHTRLYRICQSSVHYLCSCHDNFERRADPKIFACWSTTLISVAPTPPVMPADSPRKTESEYGNGGEVVSSGPADRHEGHWPENHRNFLVNSPAQIK